MVLIFFATIIISFYYCYYYFSYFDLVINFYMIALVFFEIKILYVIYKFLQIKQNTKHKLVKIIYKLIFFDV